MSIDDMELLSKPEGGPVVIVLAAGVGSRMRSSRAKPLHTMSGRSLLRHVLDAVEAVQPSQLVVVIGYQSEKLRAHLADIAPGVPVAVQAGADGDKLTGTGGAVQAGLGKLHDLTPTTQLLVVYADMPMLGGATLQAIWQAHRHDHDAATQLTVADQSSGGQSVADAWPGGVDDEAGLYVFDYGPLAAGLDKLAGDDASIALSEVVQQMRDSGERVGALSVDDAWQCRGVDDRVQLAVAGAEYNRRQVNRWMRAGVTVVDPASTWIEADVDLAQDVTLLPGTMLMGATSVASGATIGPDTTVKDCEIGEGAVISRSTVELSVVGDGATVGPYARLRPGTQIGSGGVVGTFVETKNVTLGDGARLGHLIYCGDATLGAGVDVGASVVFANWDTTNRSRVEVGAGAVIGAGALIVPPTRVDDGAVVLPGVAMLPTDAEPKRSSEEDQDATDAAKRGLEEDK